MNKNTIIILSVLAFIVVAAAIALGIIFGTGSSDSKTTPAPSPEFIEPFGSDGFGIAIYNDGTSWVAVGIPNPVNAGTILYSTNDGASWTSGQMAGSGDQPFGTNGQGNDISHDGSSWVAVGNPGNTDAGTILYSTDAVTWTSGQMAVSGTQPFGTSGYGTAISHDGTSWVAVGDNINNPISSNIVYSTNAVTWTSAKMADGSQPFGTIGGGNAIYHDGTSWVAVGNPTGTNDGTILYSTNAAIWTSGQMVSDGSQPFGTSGLGLDIYGDGTSWVAVGDPVDTNAGTILYSTNAVTWTSGQMAGSGTQPFGTIGRGWGIHHEGTSWVAVGNNSDDTNSSNILYSTGGATWFSAQMADSGTQPFGTGYGIAISHDGTSWVAVGKNSDDTNSSNILYSTDAAIWTSAQMADNGTQPFGNGTGRGWGISSNGSSWVAVGLNSSDDNSSNIVYSSDRINWHRGEMTS